MHTAAHDSIPFLNLRKLFEDHKSEFVEAITGVLEKTAFIGGEQCTTFDKNFATWVGPGRYAIGCANGTDAITLGAKALRLPEGSEAIVPAMTYVATAAGIHNAGFKVKLVDITADTWVMDTRQLEKTVTAQTKLIAPVHLYGQMAEMDTIKTIADQHHAAILEDAAQAHGATWKNQTVGFYGDVATYSFYPGKNLGAFGDAGAVLSRKKELIDYCTALGNQGGIKKYEHDFIGFNSRLDNVQAAVLNIKLKYIDGWNESRRNIAKLYRETLTGVSGITLPTENAHARHVYHLFVTLVEDREDFMRFMKDRGVDTGIHYPKAIHQLPCFSQMAFAQQSFPNAEKLAKHGVSLPMCPTLTAEQIQRVGQTVRAYFGR
jgi:dTDP-4-amino-4,6-dideoxygalactose transaminase